MKKLIASLIIRLLFFDSSAQTCFPFDTSFGVDGKAVGLNSGSWVNSTNVIVQPNKKILQFGSRSAEFIAIRYNSEGSLDSSFGVNGKTSVAAAPIIQINYGALQTDGKIVLAGSGRPANTNDYTFIVSRLNSDGSIDNSFGTAGKVYVGAGANNQASGVVIQPDGKILVVGHSLGNCFIDCQNQNFCRPLITLIRLNSSGTLDSSFGQGGIITAGIGWFQSGIGRTVSIQGDGKIVVSGEQYQYYCDDYYGGGAWSSGFFIKRFNSNGTTDSSFGQNGQVLDTTVQLSVTGFTILPDGKFLSLGRKSSGGFIMRRFLTNGAIDNTFNQTVNFNGYMNSMAALPNGKIMIGGYSWANGQNNFFLARFNSDGAIDSSFNITGKLYVRVGPTTSFSDDMVTGLALQGSHLIAGGISQTNISGVSAIKQLVIRVPDSLSGIAVLVSANGPLYPCTGTPITLSTNVQGSYQWYTNGMLVNGATSSSFVVTPSGRYYVKVNNATGCGLSDEVVLAINGLPVYIIAGGSTQICSGDSVQLKSSETTGSLQWFQNSQLINGATDSILWVKQNGYYFVKVNNSNGCGSSSGANVIVNPPKPTINWNGNFLSTVSGYTGYQWYLGGNAIPGATGPGFQPNSTGVYKVVISSYGCNPVSDNFDLNCVQVNVPKPVVTWNGFYLYTSNVYNSYQWFYNNNPVTGAANSVMTPLQTGIYRVDITGKFGCANSSIDFDLNCNLVGPGKPLINWDGFQFSVGAGYSYYQWYFNDSTINGANSYTYTPQPNKFGSYKVEVGNNYNCKIFSDPRYYAPTATVVIGDARLSYYPNPASNIFYVDILQASLKQMNAVLYDLNGKILMRKTLKAGQNQIPVERLSPGLYQLEINYGKEKLSLKLSVIR